MSLYWIPLAILIAGLAAVTLLIFTPVMVRVDSASRSVKVRWCFLLSYRRPFPGENGPRELSVAGIPVPLGRPKRETPPRKLRKGQPDQGRTEAQRSRQRIRRFLWNCLLDGDIRPALARRFRRLPVALWDAVEVRRVHCDLSLPDPATNGILWGALAAAHSDSKIRLHCNYLGINRVHTEVKLYLNRMGKAFLLFFLMLPYRALLRQWRLSYIAREGG